MKLSVLMVTYNHEKFIAQAIDSVLMQETDFDFELIVGEDCSTDKTREILLNYKEKHPEIIRLVLQEENLGAKENLGSIISLSRGQYIALLEGDDFWTDRHKLQKQVDFLGNNRDHSLVGHSYARYYDEEDRYLPSSIENFDNIQLEDFLREDAQAYNKYHLRTLSRVFRRDALINNNVDYQNVMWDFDLQITLMKSGKAACLEDVMGVYRINRKSAVQSDMQSYVEMVIAVREYALEVVDDKYKDYLYKSIENKKKMKGFYEFINKFRDQNNREKVIDSLTKKKIKKLYILGEGDLGVKVKDEVKTSDIEVVGYVDRRTESNLELIGESIADIKAKTGLDLIIIVPFYEFEEIKQELEKHINIEIISLEDTLEN